MQREKGFTLFEMVIVLAILAILAAIIVPSLYRQLTAAREAIREKRRRLSERRQKRGAMHQLTFFPAWDLEAA